MTDANVVLGRLNDVALLGGRMPIDPALARAAVDRLARELELGLEETALGIIRVACATMVKAIRSISVERGLNPAEFALFARRRNDTDREQALIARGRSGDIDRGDHGGCGRLWTAGGAHRGRAGGRPSQREVQPRIP